MDKIILFLLFLFPQIISSQTGINTLQPSATLDVNGNLRVRQTIPSTTFDAAKDSVLIVNGSGMVQRATTKQIVNSYLKTCIKGKFSTGNGALLNLSLLSSTVKIPFDASDFDLNGEFNTTNNTFKAKQDGVYDIGLQIRFDSGIAVSTHLGIAILKNGVVVNKVTYANVSALSINVTPPVRALNTLLELKKDDNITFHITSNLLGLSVLGSSEDSFFTIHQVR